MATFKDVIAKIAKREPNVMKAWQNFRAGGRLIDILMAACILRLPLSSGIKRRGNPVYRDSNGAADD